MPRQRRDEEITGKADEPDRAPEDPEQPEADEHRDRQREGFDPTSRGDEDGELH